MDQRVAVPVRGAGCITEAIQNNTIVMQKVAVPVRGAGCILLSRIGTLVGGELLSP